MHAHGKLLEVDSERGWRNYELLKAGLTVKACSIKLACKAAPSGKISSLKS
jgi:hypothetical protein